MTDQELNPYQTPAPGGDRFDPEDGYAKRWLRRAFFDGWACGFNCGCVFCGLWVALFTACFVFMGEHIKAGMNALTGGL